MSQYKEYSHAVTENLLNEHIYLFNLLYFFEFITLSSRNLLCILTLSNYHACLIFQM